MQALMDRIACVTPEGGEWCSVEKAQVLGAIVVALRPSITVEIGVWMGGSLIPIALAMKHINFGVALAIDPWSRQASVAGESSENAKWWGSIDHEYAYQKFLQRVKGHELNKYVEVMRARSDDVNPPSCIDLLHVDGNHTDQAIRDVERYCPRVRTGGIAVIDDIGWGGGNVQQAVGKLVDMGYRELYRLGTGAVFQRIDQ